MTDKPKFEVIDRRKMKAEEEEQQTHHSSEPVEPGGGPRLVVNEAPAVAPAEPPQAAPPPEQEFENALPPAPTAQESKEQKAAYEASADRVEDILRAQNPGLGKQPPVGFEHLVQQFYLSAMIQMGAGTQEGQRPRVDIVGARSTIDMLAVLAEKTKGNLNAQEDRMLQSVLFELRMAFLELTSMINMQSVTPPPSGKP
ncbi:MAG TPA: DUF1844 domain-containing protein [Terracidiphilus sp.]|nr:DUF1844 domain-containing protein [Terracidiphilus sp.]